MKKLVVIGIAVLFSMVLSNESLVAAPNNEQFAGAAEGIPLHTKLNTLCEGNALGVNGDEITWQSFSSELAPAELLNDYQNKLGKEGFEIKGQGGTWKSKEQKVELPMSSPEVSRTLVISPVQEYQAHGCYDKKPPKKAQSVLEFSAFYRRSKK